MKSTKTMNTTSKCFCFNFLKTFFLCLDVLGLNECLTEFKSNCFPRFCCSKEVILGYFHLDRNRCYQTCG